MASYQKYETFVEHFANKLIDAFGATDTWKAVIHTDAPNLTTDTQISDLIQIAGSNGYTTDGTSIAFTSTRSGGTVTATATDVTWTATGGNLGASTTGRYFSIVNSTANRLMCVFDYSATFTVAVGETMTLDFGASLFTLA
ncbi:MAG: hypothetical protein ABWY63_01005 [Hyphomicrobiaceae bacterium]